MQGLKIVYTGNGKGKTTAAIGSAIRAAGQGLKVIIIQFIKSEDLKFGEHKLIENIPNIEIFSFGKGFVGILGDAKGEDEHRMAARKALDELRRTISSGKYDMVVADEIIGAIYAKLIDESEVIELINNCPKDMHLVLTGRNVSDKIIDAVDTVTEMKEIKHHYRKGVNAQKGIEF